MVKTLGITEPQYGASVSIFYIGYVLFEIPSNCFMEVCTITTEPYSLNVVCASQEVDSTHNDFVGPCVNGNGCCEFHPFFAIS